MSDFEMTPELLSKALTLANRINDGQQPYVTTRSKMFHAMGFLARAVIEQRAQLSACQSALTEACDLADEANGDPSSCSYIVPVGERIAELRKLGAKP